VIGVFDLHTHFIPPEVLQWVKDNQKWLDAKWEKKGPNQANFLIVNNKWGFELKESFTNPGLYLQEQENAGVSHSLVSPVPQLFLYEFPEEITCEPHLSTIMRLPNGLLTIANDYPH
jgi:aminocarboxymuconate-semialdehyde decarboxylase